MKYDPHVYQDFATQKIIDNPYAGLFLDMGLGKTVSTLTALEQLKYDYFSIGKVLVIAPLRVAENVWSAEIEKWDHLRHLTISKVLGTQAERLVALSAPADIHIINRDNVVWLVQRLGRRWDFDMVVIDELSSFKNGDSKRFRALRKVRPLIKRMVGLTGTPAPNGLIDLWAQIYLLDLGERLGKTLTGYRDRFFLPGARSGHQVYEWKLKKETEQRIYERLSDICISMEAKDWLKLPERVDRVVEVKLSDSAMKLYKQMERELLLPYMDGDIVANTAAVLANKLVQMANGAVYDENAGIREIHEAKLDALEDIVEAANGKPILVFYAYKHDLARIQKRFSDARKLETSKDMVDWNAGKVSMMVAHPASAGHGLNLQAGGNQIVWFGLTWSLELYQQANARLHRQGQLERVIVHHLVALGTMDAAVMKRLAGKAAEQYALINAVKARIEIYREVS